MTHRARGESMNVLQDFRHAFYELNEWLHHMAHRDSTVFVQVTYANGEFMTSVFKDQIIAHDDKAEQQSREFNRAWSRAAQDTSMRDEFEAFAKLSAQEQRNSVKRFRQQAKRLIEDER